MTPSIRLCAANNKRENNERKKLKKEIGRNKMSADKAEERSVENIAVRIALQKTNLSSDN